MLDRRSSDSANLRINRGVFRRLSKPIFYSVPENAVTCLTDSACRVGDVPVLYPVNDCYVLRCRDLPDGTISKPRKGILFSNGARLVQVACRPVSFLFPDPVCSDVRKRRRGPKASLHFRLPPFTHGIETFAQSLARGSVYGARLLLRNFGLSPERHGLGLTGEQVVPSPKLRAVRSDRNVESPTIRRCVRFRSGLGV